MPTQAKPSLRQRLKLLEEFCNKLKINSENATFVANAMFWKHNYTNRDQIKAVVDEYMAFMQDKVTKAKEEGSLQVLPNFADPILLAKVAEHAEDRTIDSQE